MQINKESIKKRDIPAPGEGAMPLEGSAEVWVDEILNITEAAALPSLRESGRLPALISGLSPIHRVNLAAALRRESDRPLVVVCTDDTAAEGFADDLRIMLNEDVSVLGMREYVLYPAAVSRYAEQKRISVLYEMLLGKTQNFVVSLPALIQRSISREALEKAAITLEAGQTLPPEDIEYALMSCGYTRTEQVEGPGQFSRRGMILDFFSPSDSQPVRLEYWGDEIDSVSHFDITDQRRTDTIPGAVVVLPSGESLCSLAEGGSAALAKELEEAAEKYQRRRTSEQAAKLCDTLKQDAERLREFGNISDGDKYMEFIYGFETALDFIPADAVVFLDRVKNLQEKAVNYIKQTNSDINEGVRKGVLLPVSVSRSGSDSANCYCLSWQGLVKRLEDWPVYMGDAFTPGRSPVLPKYLTSVSAKQLPTFAGSLQTAADDARLYIKQGYRVVILAGDERRAGIIKEFLQRDAEENGTDYRGCTVSTGSVSAGLEYPGIKLAVLTDSKMVRRETKHAKAKRKLPPGRMRIDNCADLSPGDYVVHENHGIGRFSGIVRMAVDGIQKDYVKIDYAGTDCLYVPVTQLDLVTKYIGGGEDRPVKLSKMGGAEWARTRSRAKGAAKEMAEKLIKLYAERKRVPGFAFSPDSEWQREFEENFGYTETDDQLKCTAEIKADMETAVPMDRLLCGDVGYGKTEVALRAVMKCILDGKQAAILVPTTVLAEQHYQTAIQRFFGFPVSIKVLSRFKVGAQTTEALRAVADGSCDLVIGTHRLLSKDVQFKNLGLLVVDEEQRFGVTHKEHIKELSRGVDVLTLSATPIPRTLNMALSGIRDMSMIEDPPEDRLPVQTFVMEHDWDVITDAIRRELSRGGQVYYLHNRIDDIEKTARKLGELLEDVSIGIAHGQMEKGTLATVMEDVSTGSIQVLVCTTIIETGIDIPNVNTLIIENADRLGLAQLHQIRGRVGRSSRRASAYLTYRRDSVLTETAEKRLNAIRDFAAFGSGLKIAMRDLEIRGAGNLLGAEQSGHMTDVGYDMYMKLLSEAVLEAKGVPQPQRAECSADLAVSANIPDSYVASPEQRMDIYRRIALIRTEEEAEDILDEMIDRYGDPPPEVTSLVQVSLLRGEAGRNGITDISQKQGKLRFEVKDFDPEKVFELYARQEYRNRLHVEAGKKPCISLSLRDRRKVIEEARRFIEDWTKLAQLPAGKQ